MRCNCATFEYPSPSSQLKTQMYLCYLLNYGKSSVLRRLSTCISRIVEWQKWPNKVSHVKISFIAIKRPLFSIICLSVNRSPNSRLVWWVFKMLLISSYFSFFSLSLSFSLLTLQRWNLERHCYQIRYQNGQETTFLTRQSKRRLKLRQLNCQPQKKKSQVCYLLIPRSQSSDIDSNNKPSFSNWTENWKKSTHFTSINKHWSIVDCGFCKKSMKSSMMRATK